MHDGDAAQRSSLVAINGLAQCCFKIFVFGGNGERDEGNNMPALGVSI